jgi:hypothetical protein
MLDQAKVASHQFAFEITAIKELTCTNLKSKLAPYFVDEALLLLVATTEDLRLIIVTKTPGSIKVAESEAKPCTF